MKLFIKSLLLFLYPILLQSQSVNVKGVGICYYTNADEENNARNKAIFNAQKNALVKSGGKLATSTKSRVADLADVKSVSNQKKSSFFHKSEFGSVTSSQIEGIVQPISDYKEEKGKENGSYFIRMEALFSVKQNPVEVFLNDYIGKTQNTIKILLELNGSEYCYETIHSEFRAFFNQPDANFEFIKPKKKLLKLISKNEAHVIIKVNLKMNHTDNFIFDIYLNNYPGIYKTFNIDGTKTYNCSSIQSTIQSGLRTDSYIWRRIKKEIYLACLEDVLSFE